MSPAWTKGAAVSLPQPGRITRRQFVARLGCFGATVAAGGLLTGCAAPSFAFSPISIPANASVPLKQVASDKAILFGAATQQWILQSDSEYAKDFVKHCGVLVPENELKWATVEPQPNSFNFAPGDWLADFAAANGILFRGHCLVWHNQIPSWAGRATSAAAIQDQLTNHISQTVRHYAGRAYSWDVVNEAINPDDGRPDYLRKTVWLNALGPAYIDLAFRTAAEEDPNAILVYNDYGLEYETGNAAARRAGVLKLLTGLKASGTPVHALGIQAHLQGTDSFNSSSLASFLKEVADLGLKIFITELDVSDQRLPADIGIRDEIVADVYQQFLETVLQEPAVNTVITWGLSDKYTWLNQFSPRPDHQPVRPLPLDRSLQPKTAIAGMINAFNSSAGRPPLPYVPASTQ